MLFPVLPPELPDFRAASADWQDSIWPASSSDSRAVPVSFLLWDDWAQQDWACLPREALLVVARSV